MSSCSFPSRRISCALLLNFRWFLTVSMAENVEGLRRLRRSVSMRLALENSRSHGTDDP